MEIIAENRIGRRILRHVRELAQPRFVGSAGELRARNYIKAAFQREGYEVDEQPFTSSFFPLDIFPRLLTTAIIVALIVGYFSIAAVPAYAVETGILVLLLLVLATRWSRAAELMYRLRTFGSLRSKNIIAEHPSRENRIAIIFMAHYDSKSQNLSGPTRFALYGALSVVSTLSALLMIAAAVFALPPELVLLTLIPACLLFITLLTVSTANASPGAYDNASGVAVLLELAHSFASEQPKADLVFVATGAEEAGLCGAVALAGNEEFVERFPASRSIIINLDGIGSRGPLRVTDRYGIPPVKTGPQLARLCNDIASRFGIDSRNHWLPTGAAMDHIPFAAHGYQSVTLSTASWDRAFRAMHTRRDTADLLDIAAIEHCYAVCREIVEAMP